MTNCGAHKHSKVSAWLPGSLISCGSSQLSPHPLPMERFTVPAKDFASLPLATDQYKTLPSRGPVQTLDSLGSFCPLLSCCPHLLTISLPFLSLSPASSFQGPAQSTDHVCPLLCLPALDSSRSSVVLLLLSTIKTSPPPIPWSGHILTFFHFHIGWGPKRLPKNQKALPGSLRCFWLFSPQG